MLVKNCLFAYVNYVECIGKVLFEMDSNSLEKIHKKYEAKQPDSLTSQFPDRVGKKEAIEKQKKRRSMDKLALHHSIGNEQ